MKLLLVDDEFYVRERILKQIDWNALGVTEIQTSDNGLDALRIAEEWLPGILLTDIRMPRMDGIKLAEEFQIRYPECKVIFISGYSDIPYLRSAIRLHVVNYVEKPIDMQELTAAIRNAMQEINSQSMVKSTQAHIRKRDQTARQVAVAKGLLQETTAEGASRQLAELLGDDTPRCYATAITKLIGARERLSEEALQDWLTAAFKDSGIRCIGFLKADCIVMQLVCEYEEKYHKSALMPYFERLTCQVMEAGLQCVHAVGSFVREAGRLPESYHTALQCVSRCYFKSPGYLYLYRGDPPKTLNMDTVSLTEYSHALKEEKDQTIVSMVDALAGQLKLHNGTSPFEVERMFYAILMLMYHDARKVNVTLLESFADEYAILEHVKQFDFFDELHTFTLQTIREYYTRVRNNHTDNPIVNQIIGYMEQNYADPDLSVTMISEHMNLSSAYVCHLFKNITGATVGAYLTRLRIDMALELLRSGRHKVKEIARQVGYRNGNYFSYKFKQQMGYSPRDDKDDAV